MRPSALHVDPISHHVKLWKYPYLLYCLLTSFIRVILRWLLNGPKFDSWSLWMEIDVSVIIEAIKVFDAIEEFAWKEIRFMQDLAAKPCWSSEAIVEKVNCNGVYGEFITSTSFVGQPKTTVFYLHGGGYCLGSCASYRKPIANLSKRTHSRFLVLEYARAPEKQYPYALDQVFEAYKWLLGQGVEPSKLVVAGDSAGGGLAAALLVKLRDNGIPLPSCSVLISPWTDLSPESCMQNAKLWDSEYADFNPNNLVVRFARAYLGNANPKDPLISPHYADLSGLPPMLLMAGGDELLLPDIERFHERCKEHDMSITFDVAEHMPHVYQILHQHKEIDCYLDRIQQFIWDIVEGTEVSPGATS